MVSPPLVATGTLMVMSSWPLALMSQPLPTTAYPNSMTKPSPASSAAVGLLMARAPLSRPTRIWPRLLKSRITRRLPRARLTGLRMKMSVEYSTMPRELTGARSMSVMMALRGSFGSSSPKAMPRSFSYWPTLPKERPSKVGDSERSGSITIRCMPCLAAARAPAWC